MWLALSTISSGPPALSTTSPSPQPLAPPGTSPGPQPLAPPALAPSPYQHQRNVRNSGRFVSGFYAGETQQSSRVIAVCHFESDLEYGLNSKLRSSTSPIRGELGVRYGRGTEAEGEGGEGGGRRK
ncbi:hypothetical protein Pmani_030975 [Petrolisthes manimaculis]|uniref:Uncharacterized protein n=1 Tax=Petrolisthes manimaculis TaxID=1843537 RepID=A0AAE1NUL0_9EUCA|nr:hypothetical protein Pmani_030975 [Petrolisthes manimaculis]